VSRLPPAWRVDVAAHELPPRWCIPAQTHIIFAPTARAACERAVRLAHILARTPPWKPLLRLTWPHARAVSEPDPIGAASELQGSALLT
jgi:hypothetical protein